MNITCNNCGKVHEVPDDTVQNKKVYFFCSSCRHKIVVDSRTRIADQLPDVHPLTGFTDIFQGLFSFFHRTAFLITSLHIILSLMLAGISIRLLFVNASFFARYPFVGILGGFFLLLVLVFSRMLVLYYISKIQTYKIQCPQQRHVDWKSIHFDIEEDWVTILLCCALPLAGLFLVLLPLPYLDSFGVFYAGLLYPLIFILVLCAVLIYILYRYIPPIIATGSYYVRDGLKEICSFIAREYVHIPFYSIIIVAVVKFFGFIFLALYSAAVFISTSMLFMLLSGTAKDSLMRLLSTLPAVSSAKAALPAHVSLGAVILCMMLLLSAVFFLSFVDLFMQSLHVKAVLIMKQNPRESFNRYAMLAVLAFIAITVMLAVLILFNLPLLTMAVQKISGVSM